jgi:hypothetical protein
VELIKSYDAPESNSMIVGHSLRKNVPSRTSPVGISYTVVWMMRLDHGEGPFAGSSID